MTFVHAAAADTDLLRIAASMDANPGDAYFTRVFTLDEQRETLWSHHDVNQRIAVVGTYLVPPTIDCFNFVAMSDEGDLTLYTEARPSEEKIPGAGVFSEGAVGWGYMSALKQIGEHLYACGGAGQVYQRRGPNDWVHMDQGLLQPPDVAERLLPRAIDGPGEADIYLVGGISASGLPPFACHWNGAAWRRLPLPAVAERLTALHVESPERIWLCGANGTLLRGNAREGFTSLSTVDDNQLFLSLCRFQGRIYLASNLGLHVYDPADHAGGIRPVVTGLQPELQDANVVDAVDGVLWSIGPKDIARFDGTRWQRIHDPDNPRIGSTA